MARTLNATFVSEKNLETNRPVYLYTIWDYDGGGSNLRYAAWDADVVFDSNTYTKFPIAHDQISENNRGQVDQVKLTVGNASRVIQAHLESYDFRGLRVTIMQVYADQLGTAAAYVSDDYYIDSYTVGDTNAEFTLTSKFDIMEVVLPKRRFLRTHCQWKFKSTECGYAGAETACDKSLNRCKVLSNESRFGGFPGIRTSRLFTQ